MAEPPHGARGNFYGQLDLSDEQKEQMKELRKSGASREELHSVLTEEQQEKLGELRQGGGEHRGKRLDHMKQELDLSDEQAQEIRTILDEGGSREDVREALTDEQQEKLKELRKDHPGMGKKKPKK